MRSPFISPETFSCGRLYSQTLSAGGFQNPIRGSFPFSFSNSFVVVRVRSKQRHCSVFHRFTSNIRESPIYFQPFHHPYSSSSRVSCLLSGATTNANNCDIVQKAFWSRGQVVVLCFKWRLLLLPKTLSENLRLCWLLSCSGCAQCCSFIWGSYAGNEPNHSHPRNAQHHKQLWSPRSPTFAQTSGRSFFLEEMYSLFLILYICTVSSSSSLISQQDLLVFF